MRRSRTAVYLLSFLICGCAPDREEVFVDLGAAMRVDFIENPAPIRVPDPPSPGREIVAVQPGRPAKVIVDPANTGDLNLERMIREEQEEAYRELLKRLTDYYRRQAEAFELEQLRGLDTEAAEAYGAAAELIRDAFEDYAAERAPLVSKLALFVGWPDPNPDSIPPQNEMTPLGKKRFEEMKQVRTRLAELEKEFTAEVQSILAVIEEKVNIDLAATRLAIENRRAELDRQAQREANEQVRRSVKELGLRLANPERIRLPATSGRTVVIPPAPPFEAPPKVSSEGILTSPKDRRQTLEQELRIWAGINRCELVEKRSDGEDRTAEFIEWRKTFRPGL